MREWIQSIALTAMGLILLAGCSALNLSSLKLSAGQTWSENYARMPGVEATDPRMVDGDLNTAGQTVSETFYPRAIVKLPERKMIHKIVIYSPNLMAFTVWADKEGKGWTRVKEIKGVTSSPITVMLAPPVLTDKIMISVNAIKGGKLERGMIRRGGRKGSQAIIQEIELYGLVEKREAGGTATASKSEEEKEIEEELRDLLEPIEP